MALYFGLEVECGPEEAARSVAEHFQGLPLSLPDGLKRQCMAQPWRDVEANWWVRAAPPGASASGIPGNDDPELRSASRLSEFGHLLYGHLRTAPAFRYALAGIETSEFRYFSELDQDLVRLPFSGLVIRNDIWQRLGRPSVFVEFRAGYVWRPYAGEKRGF
jgi:hypothetical protein